MSMSPEWSPTFSPLFLSAILPQTANKKSSIKRAEPVRPSKPSRRSVEDEGLASVANAGLTGPELAKPPSRAAFEAIVLQEPSPDLMLTMALPPGRADVKDIADASLRDLLAPIAEGDQDALADFYDATVSRVYSIALRIVRHPEMAEEVVSDVYMQVWRDPTRYDIARGRVLAWLLIITRSRALDLLRRQDEAFSHPEPHDLIAEPEDSGKNPQDLLSAIQSNAALGEALGALSPLQRQLISLAFFKGLSHSEIVDHAGIPLGSVKTHIRRALIILRNVLDGEFSGNDNVVIDDCKHSCNGSRRKKTLNNQG